jgi:palmitoyl transferase
VIIAAAIALSIPAKADAVECADFWSWVEKGCRQVADTWKQGSDEVLISGYSYHVPATWTAERRAQLNANAWGGGYGRTVEDADGDTKTVFGFAFRDSHKHIQWQVGYAYSTYWGPRDGLQPGLGFTAMLVQRPDIASGFPFPVVLPFASLRYKQATLVATYIPTLNGGINHGSTLYVMGRYTLK